MNWSTISELITLQISLYIILIRFLGCKAKRYFFLYPILSLLLICFLEFLDYELLPFFIVDIFIYIVFPLIFLYKAKVSQVIYILLVVIGFFSFLNTATSFVTTFINADSNTMGFTNIITNISFTLLIFCLSRNKTSSNFCVNVFNTTKSIKFVIVFFIWEMLILLTALTFLLKQYHNKPMISLISFLIFIIMIVSCVVLYLLIINNLKSTYYKQLNATIQNNMDEQVRHYEKLSIANENLRKFRHDFNNLKIGLNTYLTSSDTSGAINYLNECSMLIETNDTLLHTGHNIVDALFSDKLQTANKYNININFEGLIPSDILTPVDLCIIFGNTLDNAIEACLNIKNNNPKNINVSVKQNRDYIFITFTNPCAENVAIKNDTILTTKENTEIHGIGLYSIKQVLKKYDGHLTLCCENKLFTTEIDFCISTK